LATVITLSTGPNKLNLITIGSKGAWLQFCRSELWKVSAGLVLPKTA